MSGGVPGPLPLRPWTLVTPWTAWTPYPLPHGGQRVELPSASAERAVVGELLARQANGDVRAGEEIAINPLYQHLSYGLAYTTGSALGCAPPSTDGCLEAFLAPNKVGLTAGVRAWTKHFHRSMPVELVGGKVEKEATTETESENGSGGSAQSAGKAMRKKAELEARAGWWGVALGPREVVNEKALALFWKVMKSATWRNLHWLPHEVLVYEVRVAEGYGMRWSQDQSHPTDRKDWESARKTIARALANNVQQVEKNKKTLREGGVYVGLSGLVLMESKIAEMQNAGLDIPELSRENLEELADRHIIQAIRVPDALKVRGTRVSFLETGIGTATLAILRYHTDASSSDTSWGAYTAVLECAVRNIINEDNDPSLANDDGCEVLYGRAGLLYAFILLRNALHQGRSNDLPPEFARQLSQLVSVDNLRVIVNSIVLRGRRGSRWLSEDVAATTRTEMTLPPLMWSWHQKRYLGAAHGVAGILQMLLSCPAEVVAPYMDEILSTVEWLIGLQDANGNWPSSFKLHKRHHSSSNELVQWCHGAPGMIILLSTLLKLAYRPNNPLPLDGRMKTSIASALHRGSVLVYRHGFLRKGLGICHGVAGSVYALLAVADVSSEIGKILSETETTHLLDYFGAAVHLSTLATRVDELTAEREMGTPDRPWSLYEGRAGTCCAWAEVLCRMQAEARGEGLRVVFGMPGYDDVGWRRWDI